MTALTMGAAPVCPGPVEEVDTLDENDYLAMKDTMWMPRRNLAKDSSKVVNLKDYAVKDVYVPSHQSFDKHWYDHIYIGGGIGVERLFDLSEEPSYKMFTSANFHVGKQITKYSGVRLGLFGAVGYQNDTDKGLVKAGLKADYLYNISTLLSGYNPARRMEVSLLAGLGGHSTWVVGGGNHAWSPEAHFGVQLKCYTGPQGVINLEPYIGIGSDNLDLIDTYHPYDLFFGLNVNYSCFTDDNLSKEARLKLLQNRMADERMVTPLTLEKWRTPWFVEYAGGLSIGSSDSYDVSGMMGNLVSLTVGRWLSPVMGFRITGATRIMRKDEQNSNYMYGAIDALLNPLGFSKNFRWNSPWGAYLAFGIGYGQQKNYYPNKEDEMKEMFSQGSQSYRVGLHFWGRLSKDLQAFIEPYYNTNVYKQEGILCYDNVYGVNVGMTMLICSHKYRDLYELDDAQNYTRKDVKGFSVGLGGGMPIIQNTSSRYNGLGMDWSIMAYLEYRFNHLHSVRLQGELLNLKIGYCNQGEQEKETKNLWLGALNYMVNLTNLCSGRFVDRKVELDGFIGPALGYAKQATWNSTLTGVDLGFKLNAYLWRGISAFITPTVYVMTTSGALQNIKTVSMGYVHLLNTINIGVQYKIGSLHENAGIKRLRTQHKAELWRYKQMEKERKQQQKLEEKRKKRF